jgi:N-methylhydantoinase A
MADDGVLIGVDVGGTFTDAVVIERGRIFRAKSPSTYPDVRHGVIHACRLAAEAADREFGNLLAAVVRFGLGTTAVTNVIATRGGLRVGLLTTRGFEDTLRLARGRVQEVDGWQTAIRSLVDPALVVGIDERIDRHGDVIKSMDPDAVLAAGRELVEKNKATSLAVSFLWSFINPAHERLAVDLLRKAYPNLTITSAAELRPVIREYERTTLAVLNAYSRSAFSGIDILAEELRDAGLRVPILICHSGGGTISIDQVREQPVWLAASGPAAGVAAASLFATMMGEQKALTCDLGGTSFDVAHISHGAPVRVQRGDLMGLWTALPRVDVESVGAGGGSIAWIDARDMLRVGPRSAGSSPGPVCYGRGGSDPTLTDALLVLGYIEGHRFLGGRMVLDRDASLAAYAKLGRNLGFDGVETAWGIREIALAEMTRAARARLSVHALSAQEHPLVSYGGCGPLFTAEIARAVGAPRVLVPEIASVLSAFGAAMMDVRRERLQSLVCHLPTDPAVIDQAFMTLGAMVTEDLIADGVPEDKRHVVFEADMRYAGQRWEVTITIPSPPTLGDGGARLQSIFKNEYLRRYGPSAVGSSGAVELVAIRAIGIGKTIALEMKPQDLYLKRKSATASGTRPVQINRAGEPTSIATFDGQALSPGDMMVGPSLVDIGDTTVWIPSGLKAHMCHDRTILVDITP